MHALIARRRPGHRRRPADLRLQPGRRHGGRQRQRQLAPDVGTADVAFGPRNGNLQITQFFYGAVQPSSTTRAGGKPPARCSTAAPSTPAGRSRPRTCSTAASWSGSARTARPARSPPTPPAAAPSTSTGGRGAGGKTNNFFQVAIERLLRAQHPLATTTSPSSPRQFPIYYTGGATSITTGLFDPEAPGGVGNQWQQLLGQHLRRQPAEHPADRHQRLHRPGLPHPGRRRELDRGRTRLTGGTEPQPLDGSAVRALAYGSPGPGSPAPRRTITSTPAPTPATSSSPPTAAPPGPTSAAPPAGSTARPSATSPRTPPPAATRPTP